MKFKWEMLYEKVSGNHVAITCRSKVKDGWIILNRTSSIIGEKSTKYKAISESQSMVFVPDINHEWSEDKE